MIEEIKKEIEAEIGDVAIIETLDLEMSTKENKVWEKEVITILPNHNLDYYNKTGRYKNNEYYRVVDIIKKRKHIKNKYKQMWEELKEINIENWNNKIYEEIKELEKKYNAKEV